MSNGTQTRLVRKSFKIKGPGYQALLPLIVSHVYSNLRLSAAGNMLQKLLNDGNGEEAIKQYDTVRELRGCDDANKERLLLAVCEAYPEQNIILDDETTPQDDGRSLEVKWLVQEPIPAPMTELNQAEGRLTRDTGAGTVKEAKNDVKRDTISASENQTPAKA